MLQKIIQILLTTAYQKMENSFDINQFIKLNFKLVFTAFGNPILYKMILQLEGE